MFTRRTITIVLLILALAAAGGTYIWQARRAAEQAAQESIRQAVVERGTILSIVSATGSLVPEAQVNLHFAASQPLPVTEVNAVLGQRVRAGEVLARLEDADLALAVTQAEQSLQAAQLALDALLAPPRPEDVAVVEANLRLAKAQVYAASLGKSEADIQIAYLNLRLAQNALNETYRRMDALVEQGKFAQKQSLEAQAQQQVEAAQIADLRYHAAQEPPGFGNVASALAAVEQAEVALDRLESGAASEDVRIAELRVKQAQTALELVQNNLADAVIVAPFDGVVAAVNVRAGELASAAAPAFVLVDVSRFHLEALVDEVDIARVAPGQPVSVTLDALPDNALAGTVEKIAPDATVNQGVVTYRVRIALAAAEALLRGGMTATADIVVDEARDVVLVPNWAVRRDRATGQAFVGTLRAGELKDVPVELGLRNESFSQVISGLVEGDVVAVTTARDQLSLFGGE